MVRKERDITILNLDLDKINEDVISDMVLEAEEILRKYIVKSVGDKLVSDLDVTIIVDKDDKLTFTIDAAFSAPKLLELDYDNIIDAAIREAARTIEKRLMKYVKKRTM